MLLLDIRYAIRMLLKSPAFTLVAVLSLGLGIGANSALFTMVNALFLQDAGIREPERMVLIHWNGQDPNWSISWDWYRGMSDDLADVFSHTTAYRLNPARTEVTGDRLVSAIYVGGYRSAAAAISRALPVRRTQGIRRPCPASDRTCPNSAPRRSTSAASS